MLSRIHRSLDELSLLFFTCNAKYLGSRSADGSLMIAAALFLFLLTLIFLLSSQNRKYYEDLSRMSLVLNNRLKALEQRSEKKG